MSKRVLSIGQCGPDHMTLSRFLDEHFDVEVVATDRLLDSLEQLESSQFDLVLVNRKLDVDYSDGVQIIKALKQKSEYSRLPIMMVTNFPEAQNEAVEAGAELGFGKLEFQKPETVERLAPFLVSE